jgi:hypothetical protein
MFNAQSYQAQHMQQMRRSYDPPSQAPQACACRFSLPSARIGRDRSRKRAGSGARSGRPPRDACDGEQRAPASDCSS